MYLHISGSVSSLANVLVQHQEVTAFQFLPLLLLLHHNIIEHILRLTVKIRLTPFF